MDTLVHLQSDHEDAVQDSRKTIPFLARHFQNIPILAQQLAYDAHIRVHREAKSAHYLDLNTSVMKPDPRIAKDEDWIVGKPPTRLIGRECHLKLPKSIVHAFKLTELKPLYKLPANAGTADALRYACIVGPRPNLRQ